MLTRKKIKFFSKICTFLLMFTLFFDGIAFTQDVNAAAAPKLTKKTVSVKAGKKVKNKLTATSYKAGWRITKATVKKTAVAKAKVKKNKKVVVVTGIEKGATKIVLKLKNAKTGAAKKIKFKVKVKVDKVQPVVSVESVTLDETDVTLRVDESMVINATVTPNNAANKTVTWESSDTDIVSIENGKVTAIKTGTATITATADGKTATCKVAVVDKIAVKSFELSQKKLKLKPGDKITLEVTAKEPWNATIDKISWKSSDSSVVSVKNGEVTAKKTGTATITATVDGIEKTCQIEVVDTNPTDPLYPVNPVNPVNPGNSGDPELSVVVPVTNVTLDKTDLEITVGEKRTLKASVLPDNARDKSVTWNSNNLAVATVSESGEITAVSVGTAIITAQAGDVAAFCTITINPIAVTGINLSQSSLNLRVGESQTLTATVAPDNAMDKTVTWTSDKTAIATVSESGEITAVSVGTAVITVKAGDQTASSTVTVNPIAVTGITLSQESLNLKIGESETLTATVTPVNATDKTVAWTSNDTGVATVSASGEVTAITVGEAIITAKAGDKDASCTVTVNPIAVTAITLNQNSLGLKIGESQTLTATVTPDNATDKTVTWISSDENVAVVSGGAITAIAAGNAIVTAKAGDKTAECTVTVTKIEAQAPQITNANTLPQNIRFDGDWEFFVDHGDVQNPGRDVGYSIKVNANVEDGGTLSYQWYLADSSEGVGSKIDNEISDTITIKEGSVFHVDPSVVDSYIKYLYVVITNTKDGETKETVSQRITIEYKTFFG